MVLAQRVAEQVAGRLVEAELFRGRVKLLLSHLERVEGFLHRVSSYDGEELEMIWANSPILRLSSKRNSRVGESDILTLSVKISQI